MFIIQYISFINCSSIFYINRTTDKEFRKTCKLTNTQTRTLTIKYMFDLCQKFTTTYLNLFLSLQNARDPISPFPNRAQIFYMNRATDKDFGKTYKLANTQIRATRRNAQQYYHNETIKPGMRFSVAGN